LFAPTKETRMTPDHNPALRAGATASEWPAAHAMLDRLGAKWGPRMAVAQIDADTRRRAAADGIEFPDAQDGSFICQHPDGHLACIVTLDGRLLRDEDLPEELFVDPIDPDQRDFRDVNREGDS
jgi:hypothetical protein